MAFALFCLHMCGIRNIQAQTRLIEHEGIKEVDQLAPCDDKEKEYMSNPNSKRTPANTHTNPIWVGLDQSLEGNCH